MNKLNWKTRLLIVLIAASTFIMALVINQILIESPSELNEKNPLFFDDHNYYLDFYYNNGTYNTEQIITVQSVYVNSSHTNVSVVVNNKLQDSFFAHPSGIVYQGGILKGNYSIWWINVPNLLTTLGQGLGPGTIYNITDPTGFLGEINSNYILIVTRKCVYWPYDQRLGNLLGAQASFEATIYNESNMMKIATATLDITTGNIEVLEGGINSHYSLILFKTNFPISRNRLNQMMVACIYGSIIIVLTYLLMRIDWKNKFLHRIHLNPDKRNETIILATTGILAVILEFVDIWFFLPLGLYGNLLIHGIFICYLGILCFIYRYKLAWLIPSILEVMFIFAIFLIEGEPYVPHLTAFMGSTISWICLVIASGKASTWSEGKTKVGKFLSKFI